MESKIPKKMFPIRGRGLECPGTHLLSARIEFRFVFGKLKHLRIDWKVERKRGRKRKRERKREREEEISSCSKEILSQRKSGHRYSVRFNIII